MLSFRYGVLLASGSFTMFTVFALLAAMGGWTVSEKQDPITDRLIVTAELAGENASIIFRCAAGERPSITYVADEYLGGKGLRYELRDFVYRFDAAAPKRASWKYYDSQAQPYSTKEMVSFVTSLIQSSRLVVRAERYDGRLIDSTFELAGSGPAFHEAFTKCGIR